MTMMVVVVTMPTVTEAMMVLLRDKPANFKIVLFTSFVFSGRKRHAMRNLDAALRGSNTDPIESLQYRI